MVTDYPHLKDQADALAAQVTSLQSADAAKDEELAATSKERDTAVEAYNGLLPLYVQAYNVAVVRHRRAWCLWICKSKPLPLPKPLTLPKPPSIAPAETQSPRSAIHSPQSFAQPHRTLLLDSRSTPNQCAFT